MTVRWNPHSRSPWSNAHRGPPGALDEPAAELGVVRFRRMNVLRVMPLLSVSDLDAAVETYVRTTGMEVIMNHGWIATLAPPGDRSIQLSLITRDATAPVNPSTSIEVDDVNAAYSEVRASGLEIVHELCDEEWGVRRFFFRDSDGSVVNVLSHL